jgi:hypothetical protein
MKSNEDTANASNLTNSLDTDPKLYYGGYTKEEIEEKDKIERTQQRESRKKAKSIVSDISEKFTGLDYATSEETLNLLHKTIRERYKVS